MTTRQWLWRWSSRAPLWAWLLSAALPLVYGGWVLQSSTSLHLETVRLQIGAVTTSIVDLQEQLEALRGRQTGSDQGTGASEDFLELLLLHRCGVRQGFDLSQNGGKSMLVLQGTSLEVLCALRAVQHQSGGVQQLRRKSDGTTNLTWEGV